MQHNFFRDICKMQQTRNSPFLFLFDSHYCTLLAVLNTQGKPMQAKVQCSDALVLASYDHNFVHNVSFHVTFARFPLDRFWYAPFRIGSPTAYTFGGKRTHDKATQRGTEIKLPNIERITDFFDAWARLTHGTRCFCQGNASSSQSPVTYRVTNEKPI